MLSFGTAIAGNVSATTLAELGADVVKIESPDRPDPLRLPGIPGLPKAFDPAAPVSLLFSSYSRSGRTLTLDMKSPAGLETFSQLVRQADVLIDNFATGVMTGWGLTPQVLAEMNPRLIWVSVSGYGRTGPRATAMAYGSNINGFMGLTRVWSPHGSQFDYTAVAHVLITIFAALAHRDRTGQGCYTEIAQAEAGGVMLAPLFLAALATGQDVWPEPNEVPGSYLSGVFAAAGQDAWLAVELEDASDWDTAARLLGVPELCTGQHGPPPEAAAVAGLKKVIAAWAQALTPAQGARQLQAAGLAAAAVLEIADLFADAGLLGSRRPGRAAPPGHRRHHLGHRPVPAHGYAPCLRPLPQPPPRPAQPGDPPRLAGAGGLTPRSGLPGHHWCPAWGRPLSAARRLQSGALSPGGG